MSATITPRDRGILAAGGGGGDKDLPFPRSNTQTPGTPFSRHQHSMSHPPYHPTPPASSAGKGGHSALGGGGGKQEMARICRTLAIRGEAGEFGAEVTMFMKVSIPPISSSPNSNPAVPVSYPLFSEPPASLRLLHTHCYPLPQPSGSPLVASTADPQALVAARSLGVQVVRGNDDHTTKAERRQSLGKSSALGLAAAMNAYPPLELKLSVRNFAVCLIVRPSQNVSQAKGRPTTPAMTNGRSGSAMGWGSGEEGQSSTSHQGKATEWLVTLEMFVGYLSKAEGLPTWLSIPTPICLRNTLQFALPSASNSSLMVPSSSSSSSAPTELEVSVRPALRDNRASTPGRRQSVMGTPRPAVAGLESDDEDGDKGDDGSLEGNFSSTDNVDIRWVESRIPLGGSDNEDPEHEEQEKHNRSSPKTKAIRWRKVESDMEFRVALSDGDGENPVIPVRFKNTSRLSGLIFPSTADRAILDIALDSSPDADVIDIERLEIEGEGLVSWELLTARDLSSTSASFASSAEVSKAVPRQRNTSLHSRRSSSVFSEADSRRSSLYSESDLGSLLPTQTNQQGAPGQRTSSSSTGPSLLSTRPPFSASPSEGEVSFEVSALAPQTNGVDKGKRSPSPLLGGAGGRASSPRAPQTDTSVGSLPPFRLVGIRLYVDMLTLLQCYSNAHAPAETYELKVSGLMSVLRPPAPHPSPELMSPESESGSWVDCARPKAHPKLQPSTPPSLPLPVFQFATERHTAYFTVVPPLVRKKNGDFDEREEQLRLPAGAILLPLQKQQQHGPGKLPKNTARTRLEIGGAEDPPLHDDERIQVLFHSVPSSASQATSNKRTSPERRTTNGRPTPDPGGSATSGEEPQTSPRSSSPVLSEDHTAMLGRSFGSAMADISNVTESDTLAHRQPNFIPGPSIISSARFLLAPAFNQSNISPTRCHVRMVCTLPLTMALRDTFDLGLDLASSEQQIRLESVALGSQVIDTELFDDQSRVGARTAKLSVPLRDVITTPSTSSLPLEIVYSIETKSFDESKGGVDFIFLPHFPCPVSFLEAEVSSADGQKVHASSPSQAFKTHPGDTSIVFRFFSLKPSSPSIPILFQDGPPTPATFKVDTITSFKDVLVKPWPNRVRWMVVSGLFVLWFLLSLGAELKAFNARFDELAALAEQGRTCTPLPSENFTHTTSSAPEAQTPSALPVYDSFGSPNSIGAPITEDLIARLLAPISLLRRLLRMLKFF